MTTLFLDESKSKGYTIVTAVLVSADVSTVRKEIAKLRMRGQSRIHFVSESDSRRRFILSALENLGLSARVYHVTGMSDSDARERCLTAIVRDAASAGVTRIVLERDESIEKFDRQILYRQLEAEALGKTITYNHESARAEPLLWIPDAIAWSFGRGGVWRLRIDALVTEVVNITS